MPQISQQTKSTTPMYDNSIIRNRELVKAILCLMQAPSVEWKPNKLDLNLNLEKYEDSVI
jgi:hypothetical protein